MHKFVDMMPDPGMTEIKFEKVIGPSRLGRILIRVTPFDILGNYLGPGYDDEIRIRCPEGSPEDELKDLLDGTYEQYFMVDDINANPHITIIVRDVVVYDDLLSPTPSPTPVSTPTLTPAPTAAGNCGDVNSDGTIDIVDALLIVQDYVGLNPANFDPTAADVDGNGEIDIVDALLVAQLYVGLIDELPGCPTVTVDIIFAVNCGGGAYKSSDGTVYAADTGYSGGYVYTHGSSVSGTSDPTLYSTERYGSCTYSASVPNGVYLVTLHFAENYHTSSGSRAFSVLMEGTQVIRHLDIYAEAGGNTAYVTENRIKVSDGQINIEFVSVTENALINAIKIAR